MNSPWNEGPFTVIWEITRASELACRHFRGEAVCGDSRVQAHASIACEIVTP